ncbi:MAG: hypothetical protein P9L96_05575 [Candidatus Gygaella obscura]|nr:hypothetical protein [Candidatus Gygaella obscura]
MKTCPFCTKEIAEGDTTCKHCNRSLTQELGERFSYQKEEVFSNIVPIKKFIFLSVISLGLYEIYWMYKNWQFIKEKRKLKIIPMARAIFSLFFIYSFFKNIFLITAEKGYEEKYSPILLSACFIMLNLLANKDNLMWFMAIFSFVPLVVALNAVNFYWQKTQPKKRIRTNFSKEELLMLYFGLLLILMSVISMFTVVK